MDVQTLRCCAGLAAAGLVLGSSTAWEARLHVCVSSMAVVV